MSDKTYLGEGILNEVKCEVNNRTTGLVKQFIGIIYDHIENKVKDIDISKIIEQLRNNSKVEQEISALWSKHLFNEGLVPEGYNGLPDNLLISNFHQEGYLDGLYVGYILAMMALADNGISDDKILDIRNYIRPYLFSHHYDNRDSFISQYKDEKYNWIENLIDKKQI